MLLHVYKYSQLWALRPEVFLHLLNCLIRIHIGGGTMVEVRFIEAIAMTTSHRSLQSGYSLIWVAMVTISICHPFCKL